MKHNCFFWKKNKNLLRIYLHWLKSLECSTAHFTLYRQNLRIGHVIWVKGIEFDRGQGTGPLYSKLPPQVQLSIHEWIQYSSTHLWFYSIYLFFLLCLVDKYSICLYQNLFWFSSSRCFHWKPDMLSLVHAEWLEKHYHVVFTLSMKVFLGENEEYIVVNMYTFEIWYWFFKLL